MRLQGLIAHETLLDFRVQQHAEREALMSSEALFQPGDEGDLTFFAKITSISACRRASCHILHSARGCREAGLLLHVGFVRDNACGHARVQSVPRSLRAGLQMQVGHVWERAKQSKCVVSCSVGAETYTGLHSRCGL
jgi:hypothetical protein